MKNILVTPLRRAAKVFRCLNYTFNLIEEPNEISEINSRDQRPVLSHSPIFWISRIRPLIIVITFSTVPAWISRRILALNHAWQCGRTQHKYRSPFVIAETAFSLLQHTFRFENLFSLVTAQMAVVDCECSGRCVVGCNICNLFTVMSHFRSLVRSFTCFAYVFEYFYFLSIFDFFFSFRLSFLHKHKHCFGECRAASIVERFEFEQIFRFCFSLTTFKC